MNCNNQTIGSADGMIRAVEQIIDTKIKIKPELRSAIVTYVYPNENKVDVYIPPEKETVFTGILNQTPFILKEGDGVELLLKDGTFNNCWVSALHRSGDRKVQSSGSGSVDSAELETIKKAINQVSSNASAASAKASQALNTANNKVSKITGGVVGHVVIIASNGEIADSGVMLHYDAETNTVTFS